MANEAMNSGCALVADALIGAVPYLVHHGENGLLYPDGDRTALFAAAEKLVGCRELCRALGERAYETITQTWNAEHAAARLVKLLERLLREGQSGRGMPKQGTKELLYHAQPCSMAPVLWEGKARGLCRLPDGARC